MSLLHHKRSADPLQDFSQFSPNRPGFLPFKTLLDQAIALKPELQSRFGDTRIIASLICGDQVSTGACSLLLSPACVADLRGSFSDLSPAALQAKGFKQGELPLLHCGEFAAVRLCHTAEPQLHWGPCRIVPVDVDHGSFHLPLRMPDAVLEVRDAAERLLFVPGLRELHQIMPSSTAPAEQAAELLERSADGLVRR